ncbi:hypothetical protein [Paenarthrobacter sp. YIM B13468]
MSTQEEIPDQCPKCGGEVRMRPQIEPVLGSRGKEWRCAKACVSWTVR